MCQDGAGQFLNAEGNTKPNLNTYRPDKATALSAPTRGTAGPRGGLGKQGQRPNVMPVVVGITWS